MTESQWFQKEMSSAQWLNRIPLNLFSITVLIISAILFVPVSASIPFDDQNSEQALETNIFIPLVGKSPSFAGSGDVYYLDPNGDDNNTGRSESEAWATFNHAWQFLYPGDTLILLDGIYYQSLSPNLRNGEPGYPITIKAKNDGKAIIDGQGERIPVYLHQWGSGSYYVIEGIVAQNSSQSVIIIQQPNNVLRRVSGYNANTDGNDHVFIIMGHNNLVEDCVAAGTGRKMILVFQGEGNIVRRCFADWQSWDGRSWHDCWPWGDGIEIYGGNYHIIENSISYSRNPTQSINLNGQGGVIGNRILGSMAISSGMHEDGTPMVWGDTRPQPTEYTCVRDFDNWPGQRAGFGAYEAGLPVKDNLWQDIFSWGNAGLGISWTTGAADPGTGSNRIIRATVLNNGLDNPDHWGGIHTDAVQADLDRFDSIEDSFIENIYTDSGKTTMNGEGARLTHQYIDGLLTDEPLWPWPMEQRIRDEMGISVTNLMASIIPDQISTIPDTDRRFLSLSSPMLRFGNVKLGQSASNIINLTNTGSASFTIEEYQFGIGGTQFAVTAGGTCPNPPFTLAPTQSCSLVVTFTPNNYQSQTDDLIFYSSELPQFPSPPSVYVSGLGYSTSSSILLPGRLEAEAFINSDGAFVITPTIDNGGSGKIAFISGGAWLEYPVDISQSGDYEITARVASNQTQSDKYFSVSLDGGSIATFYPPDTGGWENFTDITVSNVQLSEGSHTLRINLTTGSFDLNYLIFNIP